MGGCHNAVNDTLFLEGKGVILARRYGQIFCLENDVRGGVGGKARERGGGDKKPSCIHRDTRGHRSGRDRRSDFGQVAFDEGADVSHFVGLFADAAGAEGDEHAFGEVHGYPDEALGLARLWFATSPTLFLG
jgi:hypothetical protein